MEEISVAAAVETEAKPDGTPGSYGRIWLNGKQVRRTTYNAATGVTPEEPQDEGESESPNPLSEFAALAQMLAEAGDNKRKRDAAVDKLESALANLSTLEREDQEKLASHPTIQRLLGMVEQRREERGVRPGEITGEGLSRTKQPWRKEDLTPENGFEYVEYTPSENIPVTWNGITVNFFEGVNQLMPRVFLDTYLEAKRLERGAREHRALLMASRAERAAGMHNDVPSDPSILVGQQGARSRMLRGGWDGGLFLPGAGLGMEVPDADRPGVEDLEGEVGE